MLPFIATAHLICHRLIETKIRVAPPLSSASHCGRVARGRRKRPSLMLGVFVAAMLLSISGATRSRAETLGDARIGFTAERVLVLDGRRYVGRMWHMPGEQRHEQDLPAIKPVFILRAGSKLGDVVLPQLHTVIEFTLPKELSILGDANLLRKPVAQEIVNGIATTKYFVEEDLPGGRIAGSLWLSPDGIPMRCDAKFETKNGKRSTIYWELRHVKLGKQDAALFQVPHGYAKLPPEAAAPLFGMRMAQPAR